MDDKVLNIWTIVFCKVLGGFFHIFIINSICICFTFIRIWNNLNFYLWLLQINNVKSCCLLLTTCISKKNRYFLSTLIVVFLILNGLYTFNHEIMLVKIALRGYNIIFFFFFSISNFRNLANMFKTKIQRSLKAQFLKTSRYPADGKGKLLAILS